MVLVLVDWCGTLIGTPALHRPLVLAASSVQVANWTALCVRGWRTRLRPLDATLACAVATVTLAALASVNAEVVAPATRIQFVVIPAALSAALLPLAWAITAAVPPVAAYLAGAVPIEGWLAVGELWPVLSAVAAAGVAAPTLRTAANAAEDAQIRLQRVRAARSRAERLDGLLYRTDSRAHARHYVRGLIAPLERKNGWTIAEYSGDPEPKALQRFLNLSPWDADEARDLVRVYAMEAGVPFA